jgi:hypothetical protein
LDQLGFDVAGIARQSAAARNLATDLRSVQRTWLGGLQSAALALGLTELVTAFGDLRQAWDAQFDVYVDVVSELSGRLETTAASYNEAENATIANARAVSG